MRQPSTRIITFVTVTALLLAAGLPVAAQRLARPERFHGLAVQLGASPGSTTLPIDLSITRLSTDQERDTVLNTILEQPSKLVDVLRKMPSVGRLSSPGNVGYDLRYVEHTKVGTSDRFLLLTDRPVGFAEAVDNSRTLDYSVTVIELRVPPAGQGQGKIAVAARLSVDPKTKALTAEDWNISPVLIQSLERERR